MYIGLANLNFVDKYLACFHDFKEIKRFYTHIFRMFV